jgi:hypothetical protein
MTGYTVYLEYDLTGGGDVDAIVDWTLATLHDVSPAVAVEAGRLSVTVSTAGLDTLDALGRTLDRLKDLETDLVGFATMTDVDANAALEVPAIPPLIGAAEVAEILGVSRQRVHNLYTTNASFPAAAYQLRQGRLWLESDVRSWGAARPRRA